MRRCVLVSGTWGATWAREGTAFRQLLAEHQIEPVIPPFEWSEDVSGIPSLFTGGKHSDWRAGGYTLGLYLARIPYADRIIIAHSYGGNLCPYAALASTAVPIRRLITVGTPYREDMIPVWRLAQSKIGFHVHVCDPNPPFIETIAQVFDGRFGWARAGHPTADVTIRIPRMKHSRILDNDKGMVRQWREVGLLDYLTADLLEGERHVV